MIWRLSLLGGFRLERPGEKITRLRTQKTIALLAWLALHPQREHGREELIERFWPETELEQGRASLRVALNALRKVLEPPPTPAGMVLVTTRTHVRLQAEALVTDVAAFEAAVRRKATDEALRLYTGPFLPGTYDEWVLQEQERLQALFESLGPGSPTPRAPVAEPAATIPSSLPLTFTRFFGRQAELAALQQLLQDPQNRVITLTGPGGTGKTRLAIEAARGLSFPGGIWFVPLAEIRDAQRLPESLQSVLELPRTPSSLPLEALRKALGSNPALFLLDNLEQLVDEAALVLPTLLKELPTATFLVTSRIRLGLPGETVLAIKPLPLPESNAPLPELAGNPAMALFCDRARAALPEFGLTARNAPLLAELCRRLEGVPLALELAASWAGQLTPRQMWERFDVALELEGRNVDRDARHLSVRAALRWSLDLLPPELQERFAQLAVFQGGFTCEAVAQVCLTQNAAFELGRLREHSLLTVELGGELPRFSMLETVHEFATKCLGVQQRETQARHASWALSLAERQPPLSVTETLSERANLEAALALFEATDPQQALRLAAALARPWLQAGLLSEGIRNLERTLAPFPEDLPLATGGTALNGLGSLYFYQSDYRKARHSFERRLKVAQQLQDTLGIGEAQRNLGTIAVAEGDFQGARSAFEQALAQALTDGNNAVAAMMHTNLGVTLYALQELAGAAEHFRAGIALCDGPSFYRVLINCWHGLGVCLVGTVPTEELRRCHTNGLEVARILGEPLLIADGLLHLAYISLEHGALGEASAMIREAAALIQPLQAFDAERKLFENAAQLAWCLQRPQDAHAFLNRADCLLDQHQLKRLGKAQSERDTLAQKLATLTPPLATAPHTDEIYALLDSVTRP